MAYWIVTDSDWEWDHSEGGGPIIVQAESAEDAARQGWERIQAAGADGCHMVIGRINTVGWCGADAETGVGPFEPAPPVA